MSSMGIKIASFDLPVCNSFQAKILNDQLCYEVDLNKYSNKDNIEGELKSGFNFLMDYNEDRQVTFDKDVSTVKEDSLVSSLVESHEEHNAFIYLNTIGEKFSFVII